MTDIPNSVIDGISVRNNVKDVLLKVGVDL